MALMSMPETQRDFGASIAIVPSVVNGQLQHFITIRLMYTGQVNGEMTDELFNRWIQPFINIYEPIWPISFHVKEPVSELYVIAIVDTDHHNFRYEEYSFFSDELPNAELIEITGDSWEAQMNNPGIAYTEVHWHMAGGAVKDFEGKNAWPWRDIRVTHLHHISILPNCVPFSQHFQKICGNFEV